MNPNEEPTDFKFSLPSRTKSGTANVRKKTKSNLERESKSLIHNEESQKVLIIYFSGNMGVSKNRAIYKKDL